MLMALKYADGADSFQRLAVPSVLIKFHVGFRGRVELTLSSPVPVRRGHMADCEPNLLTYFLMLKNIEARCAATVLG